MANYSNLKTAIENAVDWNNGDNEITGQNLLDILETIIDSLGAKYKFADVATPASSITTPDEPLFYLAGEGTYTNFSGLSVTIPRGTLAIFYYDTAWHYTTVRTDSDAFFNVNQYLGTPSTTYTKANGRNAIPSALRSKGMIITYLTTNGWLIEQNLSTSGTWNADANWQTIGPVSVSQNSQTGHIDITIGDTTTPVASVKDISDDAKSFLRLSQGGKIVASPTMWFHNTANCEVVLKFKMPSAISSTSFLLSWQGGDGASYLYLDAQNIMYVVWEGTRRTYFSIADYLGKDVELRLVRYGGSAGNPLYLYINGEQKWGYNANSVGYSGNLYIGSYIESYESNLVTDYHYLYIRNLDTQGIEVFNACSSFVELSAEKYVCGVQLTTSSTKFEDLVNYKGIISDNLTISSAIVLPANTHLRGENCKVTIVGNNASITLQDGCSLEGFDFDGGASYTRQSKTDAHPGINPEYRYDLEPVVSVNDISRIGTSFGNLSLIKLDGKNASVENCTFENFYNNYSAIKIIASDNTTYNGTKQNSVINCHFNDGFLAIDNRSEFSRIIGCEFKNFAFGLYAYAGNLNLSACHFVRCDIGVVVANSGNGGHSQYSGCEWAHNGVYGLYAESLPTRLGLCISGGQFADAPIGGLLGGLCITGSRIDSWFSFQFATATGTCNMIHDCIFDLTTLSRDYPPSEYGVPGYLDYYFQLAEGCNVDLKNNISLNPQYLPNTILNN